MINSILQGNNLETLKLIPSNYVNCCITSPPYYGLRDYETAIWTGGDNNCDHTVDIARSLKTSTLEESKDSIKKRNFYHGKCKKCGAIRIDDQIGLEETPELYIEKLVLVFNEVKRILRADGTLWINIGDSYAGSGQGSGSKKHKYEYGKDKSIIQKVNNCKPKDLIGIPWMLAFALRKNGYYLRQDIIWNKLNPLPESVTDRCTKSHEYIFLLSKSKNYYFNSEAIKEPAVYAFDDRGARGDNRRGTECNSISGATGKYRNKRDVWTIATESLGVAHFAVYPQKLILPCVLCACPENGIILDPFMGSGTTAVVAIKNLRNYIGCELNPEYIKIAEKRIKDESGLFNAIPESTPPPHC